jgi:hypothetical protein
MQQKKFPKFTLPKAEDMPNLVYKSRLLIALLIAALILATTSCKKAVENVQENILEQYFEQNILNRDFRVKLATDTSNDLTADFDGYLFRLLKTTLYEGEMTGTKNSMVYHGHWSCNADYSKLTITFETPTPPAEFDFIIRPWRFTRKAVPVMELAPWGTSDPKVLHMERL